ncbi:MAG: carboxypeptidase-like regulatory domain-containing protein, partial [Planctomycetota bacterium]
MKDVLVGALLAERAHWTTGILTTSILGLTDEAGAFNSSDLPPGEWRLFLRGPEVSDPLNPVPRLADHAVSVEIPSRVPDLEVAIEAPGARLVHGRVAALTESSLSPFFVMAIPVEHVPYLPTHGRTGASQDRVRRAALVGKLDTERVASNPTPARFHAGYRAAQVVDGVFDSLTLTRGVAYTLRVLHSSDAYLVEDAFSPPLLLRPASELPGHRPESSRGESVDLEFRPSLIVKPEFRSAKGRVQLGNTVRVAGNVRLSPEAEPDAGTLRLRPTEESATSCVLEIDDPRFEKTLVPVPLLPLGSFKPITLSETLSSARVFRVSVRDDKGRPLPGARVFLAEAIGADEARQHTEAIANTQGVAHLRDLSNLPCRLGVTAPGWAPSLQRPPFERRKDGSVHVQLSRGSTVRIEVAANGTTPVRGALVARVCENKESVDLFGASGGSPGLRFTDASGVAHFPNLSPGNHKFGLLLDAYGKTAIHVREKPEGELPTASATDALSDLF